MPDLADEAPPETTAAALVRLVAAADRDPAVATRLRADLGRLVVAGLVAEVLLGVLPPPAGEAP